MKSVDLSKVLLSPEDEDLRPRLNVSRGNIRVRDKLLHREIARRIGHTVVPGVQNIFRVDGDVLNNQRANIRARGARLTSDHAVIDLPCGNWAIVSLEDADLGIYGWSQAGTGYCEARYNKLHHLLHRDVIERVLNRSLVPGEYIDHINRERLDCRRSNLRIVDAEENTYNLSKRNNTSSAYKGVCLHKPTQRWVAYITHRKRRIHLGIFVNEIDAAKAYDTAASARFGVYANLNFSEPR